MTDLEPLRRAAGMLAAVETAQDAVDVINLAAVAAEMAERARLGRGAANSAKAIECKAMIRLADLVDEGQANGTIRDRGRPKKVSADTLSSFKDLGITKSLVQKCSGLRDAYTPDQIDDLEADLTARDGELTVTRALSLARKADPNANDWYTPPWLFEQIGLRFDLDVCAPADEAMRTCPANAYYTEADDGLAQPWHGLVWCNPPYATPEPWADRIAEHGNGILLVHMPNNAGWMVRAQRAASSVRLVQSIHFVRPTGELQRPGYSLLLATYGEHLIDALDGITDDKAGPLWTP